MNKEAIGYADEAAVVRMKQENPGGVFYIETNGHVAYFREPTRHDVNAALAIADPERPLAVAEKFGQLLFLQGSKEVLTQDAMFLGASIALRQKMNGVTAYLGNL
jgi:hypothetical protein